MENTIAVVSDPLFLEHSAGMPGRPGDEPRVGGHPERPERLDAASAALARAVFPAGCKPRQLPPRDATLSELGRVHSEAYLEQLTRTRGLRGHLDGDTYFSPASYDAATRAAGGSVALVDALLDGTARHGVALVRPPGHHARPSSAMGFCLLNNVAVAAAHARARGLERVAIVDWDVHHGNGTQEIFYDDPSVLYVSLHQFPFYPGTGAANECGAGDGVGATLNVPLSAGAGDAAYVAAFDRIVGPALSDFAPDLVLISAGFDAHHRDPLAAMRVTEQGFAEMLRRIQASVPGGLAGRLGIVLEGGYDLRGLEGSLHAVLEALDSAPTPAGTGEIEPVHEADLERALMSARRFRRLG
jgi:acetoin utilization deacetylase AcuC-like enzyme